MTKTLDDYFIDWESHVFGYGYGTGEPVIIPLLVQFLDLCRTNNDRGYDYEVLEAHLGAPAAWLLINALCHANILEYGTSPRFGWLTARGTRLRDYAVAKGADGLMDVLNERTQDTTICMPDACNCGPNGYQAGVVCQNPFWLEKVN